MLKMCASTAFSQGCASMHKTLHGPYLDDGGQRVLHNGLTAQKLHAQRLLELNGAHLLHARLHQALSKGLRLRPPATL